MSSTDEKAADPASSSSALRDAALAEFSQAFLRRLPDAYTASVSAESLWGQIESVFKFAESRRGDPVAVRVFDPDLEQDGYEAPGTVVDLNVNDSPFIVDSVTAALEQAGQRVVTEVHTVVGTVRSKAGALLDVTPARGADRREAIQHYQLRDRLDEPARVELEKALRGVLGDVQAAVRDFEPMQGIVERMKEVAREGAGRYSSEIVSESEQFLDWLLDLNFIFLGYREYAITDEDGEPALSVVPGSGLGLLRDTDTSRYSAPVPISELPVDLRARYSEGFLVVVSKTNRISTVHRPARMDYIGIRHIGPDGSVIGEARLIGLFTSRAYMSEAASVPILRGKLGQILQEDDLIEGSHDHKAMVQLFNSFPKDELWSMSVDDLRNSIHALQQSAQQENVRLFVHPDLLERSVSLLVVMPRERFSATLRRRLQKLFLKRFQGSNIDYQLSLGEGGPARIHFTLWVTGGSVPDVPFEELQQEVIELSRTWDDRLSDVVGERFGEAAGDLVERWSPRMPDYYKTSTRLDIAAGDLVMLDELMAGDRSVAVGLQNDTHPSESLTRLAVYSRGGKQELSAILPVLEALGLRVVEEVPTRLVGTGEVLIHDFGVRGPGGGLLDLDRCADRVAEAVSEVLEMGAEFDSLDRLITASRLDWRQVGILRAYRTYWRRVRPRFTNEYMNHAFVENPEIAEALIALFQARFDPASDGAEADELRANLLEQLDAVRSLDQDLILRAVLGLIEATVRTNAFQPDRGYLSFKIRSAEVPDMPEPHPLFEIYVYAPGVEGIHLRGGMVARGGIRWSSRMEDYRTEVLGLMKAQRTKNAIIVPGGAKGGFVLRRPPLPGESMGEAIERAYKTFIYGLLDITDNFVGGEIGRPAHVRHHDDDDPYLVVAADRGTARFSDTANAIAAEYGFWLGDAFASGGSAGYDHKVLAITARGAWESAKRHFHDLGTDVTRTPITVVGIGDMSGDVFGNGMLLSEHLQLVAAFDHRHIFVDPTPDPATSFVERRRLFDLPGSSWDDYDRSLLSPGGGVFPRDAKRIDLSDEIRSALEIEATSVTPVELVRSILLAPVDLLWNGGIGTYVKATSETDADADDRSNDAVRVNGEELRCWVVVEGGNLGLTQKGRIEYAARGGRINADFIDNSGGVDCSDREVNLKILLRLAQERGELASEDRAGIIASVTEDVTDRVVYDNFLQAQILSQEAGRSSDNLEAFDDLMKVLEGEGMLDRVIEYLPSSEELAERTRERSGLERPELAVLLAYAKRWLRLALLRSDVPDGFEFADDLMEYFPEPIVKRFGPLAVDHPLRREIIATRVANRVVNSEGITFVSRLGIETGASPAEVVRAYQAGLALTGAVERWEAVEALDASIGPQVRGELMDGVDRLVEAMTRWYLRRGTGGGAVAPTRTAFDDLASIIHHVGTPDWRADRDDEVASLIEMGVPEELARRHAYQDELFHAPDIIELAELTARPVGDVADVFFLVGDAYRLDWLEDRADHLPAETRWERWAIRTLESDLQQLRRDLAEKIMAAAEIQNGTALLEYYRSIRADEHARLDQFLDMLARDGGGDLHSLIVASHQIEAVMG
ncbi:MAG: NAD-glutamate dehydrogenase [Acidimicrobiia bacterium]|nr:NAD-glutamate dehydrogenase [Acidimicrobiia bacterium]